MKGLGQPDWRYVEVQPTVRISYGSVCFWGPRLFTHWLLLNLSMVLEGGRAPG